MMVEVMRNGEAKGMVDRCGVRLLRSTSVRKIRYKEPTRRGESNGSNDG